VVRSAVDYIARRLAIDWLPYPERAALGVYTLTERVHRLVGPTTTVRPPRRARDTATATATRLWAEAERLTGTALPASASRP
jgi:hypothetical protein